MLVREAVVTFERGLIGQGASANTVATYMRHLEVFSRVFEGKAVNEITTTDINEFLFQVRLKADGSEKAPRTMNSLKTALKAFFKSLPLTENPTKQLKIKRVRIERDYLTEDEVRELLAGVDNVRDHTIVAVLCFLGLRREELGGLTVADVKAPSLRILGKGGVERDIPINKAVRSYIDQFLKWKRERGESVEGDAPLFVSRKHHRLSGTQLYNVVRKWTLLVLGKQLYPHSLRHSFASALVAKNVNIATIQRLMGHASISMTEVYLHISNELKQQAVEALTG